MRALRKHGVLKKLGNNDNVMILKVYNEYGMLIVSRSLYLLGFTKLWMVRLSLKDWVMILKYKGKEAFRVFWCLLRRSVSLQQNRMIKYILIVLNLEKCMVHWIVTK